MTLITTPTLTSLWMNAHIHFASDKRATAKLWFYLWNKHFFTAKEWVVSIEPPPPGKNEDRSVDIVIENYGKWGAMVLAVHSTGEVGDGWLQTVSETEERLLRSCKAYLEKNPEILYVFAFTSVGTMAKAWVCHRRYSFLAPLRGYDDPRQEDNGYVEVHSDQAWIIERTVGDIVSTTQ